LLPTTPDPVLLLIGAGATSFFIAPVLYFEAIERVGIFLPSLLMGAIPVFTLGFTAVLLGQIPSTLGLIGVPVAVVGGLLAVRGSQAGVLTTELGQPH
jgi:drug/metabolite transporter (DMT)-like permease